MPTKFLYWYDSYIREFEATVVKIDRNKVWLEATAFHPRGGGVANDTGKIVWANEEYTATDVIKEGD